MIASKQWNFDSELALLQTQIPDLKICCKTEWGSKASPDHRIQIRDGIIQFFSPLNETVQTHIMNLEKLPAIEGSHVSISHCEYLGGFAAASAPIGFDILDRKRLNLKVIQRVCSEKEIKSCGDPILLWPAKESVFKLAPDQFKLIADIQILTWMKISEAIYRFEASKLSGFVIEKNNFLFGVSFYA